MALIHLVSRGYCDHIAEFTEYNKIRKDANKLSKKIVVYKQLDFEFIKNDYYIRLADYIDTIDLVIENDIKTVKIIEFLIDGIRFDIFDSNDLETQINTQCELFGKRRIRNINGKTFIPLEMFLMNKHNLFSNTKNIQILVNKLNTGFKIFANHYFLESGIKRNDLLTKDFYNSGLQSSTISYKLQKGINTFTFSGKQFDGLLYIIYFWGFDKSKVTNIQYNLDDQSLYNCSLEVLENFKLNMGYTFEPCAIFLSQDRLEDYGKQTPTMMSLNTTRIGYNKLIIETTQENETNIHFVLLRLNFVKTSKCTHKLLLNE
jgi:hypothetical protein